MFVNMRKDPHIWFVLIALCFLIFVATGCKKARLRAQLKDLMASTIVLPEKISCVYNGEIFPMPDSVRNKVKLIVYLDSTECASCRISHLETYHHLFHLSEETGAFEVMMLLSNIELYGMPLSRYVLDQELEHPLYLDDENKFLQLNPSIPTEEKRMHAFLTDKIGAPIYVGDPSVSEEIFQLFMDTVNSIMH